jgi:hypothetical protein
MTNPRNPESPILVPFRAPEVNLRRRELQRLRDCRFVDPAEYRRLLLSRRRLERADEPRAALRGLRDVRSGRRYLVEDELLK